MRIAVMGAGGVGGYFGAQFASAGHEVSLIARGAHLDALRANGLTVESAVSPVRSLPVQAVEDPAQLAPVDVVMFCVKLWDVEAAAPTIAPLLAGGGIVIPFQNGVDSHRVLMRILGPGRVAGGVAQIGAVIRAPGIITHTGTMARLRVGAFPEGPRAAVQAFADAGRSAGIAVDVVDDINRALWEKFVFLAAMSGSPRWHGSRSARSAPIPICARRWRHRCGRPWPSRPRRGSTSATASSSGRWISSTACRPRCVHRCSTTSSPADGWKRRGWRVQWRGWPPQPASPRRSARRSTRR